MTSQQENRDLKQRLEALQIEAEIARIDREWDQYCGRDEDGGEVEPCGAASLFFGCLVIGFSLYWHIWLIQEGFEALGLGMLLGVGLGAWMAIAGPIAAGEFYTRRDQYDRRRERLLDRLGEEHSQRPRPPRKVKTAVAPPIRSPLRRRPFWRRQSR